MMSTIKLKNADLQQCQVETPPEIVSLLWDIARAQRPTRFDAVLDLGAGDARFAQADQNYERYDGIEVDKGRSARKKLPTGARVVHADALAWRESGYSLAIGNPPFIRHHNLEPRWRERVLTSIEEESNVRLARTANLFAYFLMQALLRTRDDGLVVQLVPYEWVTRPSAKALRDYIRKQKWDVRVLRFDTDIFPTVLTTASITIIDKSTRNDQWTFGSIGADGKQSIARQPSGSHFRVLDYERRQECTYAQRGLSPGGQDIFVLTEEGRLHYSLKKGRDVIACVTSLRSLPESVKRLGEREFEEYFVSAGKPCWLIRSDRDRMSDALTAYLEHVGNDWMRYSTCTVRKQWWKYVPHDIPSLLVSSGFVGRGPKVVVNTIGAAAVGSVYGVFTGERPSATSVAKALRAFDFRRRVVSHANDLRKIEVHQLNAVLNTIG